MTLATSIKVTLYVKTTPQYFSELYMLLILLDNILSFFESFNLLPLKIVYRADHLFPLTLFLEWLSFRQGH